MCHASRKRERELILLLGMTDAPKPSRAVGYDYVTSDEERERDLQRRKDQEVSGKRARKKTVFYAAMGKPTERQAPAPRKRAKKRKQASSGPSSAQSSGRRAVAAKKKRTGAAPKFDASDPAKVARMRRSVDTLATMGEVLRSSNGIYDFMYRVLRHSQRGRFLLRRNCSHVCMVHVYRNRRGGHGIWPLARGDSRGYRRYSIGLQAELDRGVVKCLQSNAIAPTG
jgi:hypothetical protein